MIECVPAISKKTLIDSYVKNLKKLFRQQFVDQNWSDASRVFDKEIVIRSLNCILKERCPLTDSSLSVVHFDRDHYYE